MRFTRALRLLATVALAFPALAATTPAHAAATYTEFQDYATGKCIGISRNYAGDWDCTWANDQRWVKANPITRNVTLAVGHDGTEYYYSGNITYYQYRNADPAYASQCLAVSTGGTSSGLQLRAWQCSSDPGGNPDEWWAELTSPGWSWMPNGVAYMVNYWSSLVIGVSAGSGANGQPVLQYTALDHPDQWWMVWGSS